MATAIDSAYSDQLLFHPAGASLDQVDRSNRVEHSAEKYGEFAVERVVTDCLYGPLKIPARGDDELYLIGRFKQFQIRPMVILTFTTVWAL